MLYIWFDDKSIADYEYVNQNPNWIYFDSWNVVYRNNITRQDVIIITTSSSTISWYTPSTENAPWVQWNQQKRYYYIGIG